PGDTPGPLRTWTTHSTSELAAPHGPPQIVTRAHLVDQLPLPFALHLNASGLARTAGDVGTAGELVLRDAVLPHEDDPRAAPTGVLDDRLRPAVVSHKRLDASDQPGAFRCSRHRRIGTICHAKQRRQAGASTPAYRPRNVMLITDSRSIERHNIILVWP